MSDEKESTVDTHPVLIVGAGPAGLVTAIELARHGVAPLVIERHPTTSIFPRATGISTRSMEIFRSHGIDAEVRRGGWRVIPRQATVTRLDERAPTEEPLGFPDEADCLAVSPVTAAVSPQDHLEPVLVEHLRSLGGDVRFSTELESFDQDADGIEAVIRDRLTGVRTAVRAAYLVGADGHRSAIRERLGIPMDGPDDLGRYLSILVRADLREVLGERVYGLYMVAASTGAPFVLVPSGTDDRYVVGVPLPPELDEAAAVMTMPASRVVAMLRAATGREALEVDVVAMGSFAFSAQVAARWRSGRAFLVGDAAHRMTPRGGRGLNTAVADGHDLGWKLAWVFRGVAGDPLLDTYEAERGPIGRRNVALSAQPGGGGSDDGLAEDLGPLDGRVGARAPHVWLGEGADRLSTLDLFGRDLVVLSAGDGRAWAAATAALDGTVPIRHVAVADTAFAAAYRLRPGGAALVRPDGVIAGRWASRPADPAVTLGAAVAVATGRGRRGVGDDGTATRAEAA
jgi:putative polyketide hydroxylase